MTNDDLTNQGSVDKEWKDYWRELEGDPSTRREVRKEKSAERKRRHKQDRRNIKGQLRDWSSDE